VGLPTKLGLGAGLRFVFTPSGLLISVGPVSVVSFVPLQKRKFDLRTVSILSFNSFYIFRDISIPIQLKLQPRYFHRKPYAWG